jgi:hypothetical protein
MMQENMLLHLKRACFSVLNKPNAYMRRLDKRRDKGGEIKILVMSLLLFLLFFLPLTPNTYSADGDFYLSFPLDYNPYNAVINSVFDHHQTSSLPYCADGIITTYCGDQAIANRTGCTTNNSLDYYSYPLQTPTCLVNYNLNYTTLSYEGHPGYDYKTTDQRADGKINVYAAAEGYAHLGSSTYNTIYIDHGNGPRESFHLNNYQTFYLHLDRRDIVDGQWVDRRQIIGIAGATGTGDPPQPRLHFEVRKNTVPVDPYGWTFSCLDPYTRLTNIGLSPNIDLWTPPHPNILDRSINPNTAAPGDILNIIYKINNPAQVPIQNIRLGARIRTSNPQGQWIDDPANDEVVILSSGDNEYSRRFKIPQTVGEGFYDVEYVILDHNSGQWIDSEESSKILNVVTKPLDFYLVSGTLGYANGNLANGCVYASERTGANLGNYVCSYGSYSMALFPGTYDFWVSLNNCYMGYTYSYVYVDTEPQTVVINTNTTRNIIVPSYQFYHVTGKVTDTGGNGLPNVAVQIYGNNINGNYCSSSTTTGSDGSYDTLVTGGTYTLDFVPPSGGRFARKIFSNVQVPANVVKDVSLSQQFVLSGNIKDANGNPTQAWVYANVYPYDPNNPGNYGWSNPDGTYQLSLLPGTYVIGGYAYIPYSQGYAWITLPQQTKTINSDSVLNFTYPAHQFYHLRGKVTDVNNIGQPNVNIQLWDNIGTYSTYAWTSGDGSYDALLIAGTYTMEVSAPPETYPPFEVKKIDITGDTTRNIRLSLSYTLLDQTIAKLSPGLDLAIDVFDIISHGASTIYNVVIKSTKKMFQIILNWPGSQMGITVYRPDGSIYGQYQSSTPPIIIDIQNPDIGTWKCEVEAIEVPYDNYPFALVAGVTPNQPPVAKANGPYSGTVGSPITFDASGSYDPDGSIVSYEWDWNNDGFY